ncbi:MAG: hypothetical protein HRT95_11280 [Moritella sp.]|uniref:hypothetical protein n=1 Tax=Moritella sp. TaxID=78556 RepID=UPI001DC0A164|nr:hypothetical protein [Moritella sp.]NQZ50726.1 hypothetical protein [Moritella sp.]
MNKKLLVVAIASVLGLAGCGGGGSDDSAAVQQTQTNFSGTVNKGIVSNGKVEACDTFDSDGCTAGQGWSVETTTNAAGQYDINSAPLNKPLLVMVSKKDASTKMMCDVAICYDSDGTTELAKFGTKFEVAADWQLKTIIPAANSETAVVNVTALTDVAAIKTFEAAGNSAVTATMATNANRAVKAAFSIGESAPLSTFGAVDLTDKKQVEAADATELSAALYSAALITATNAQKIALITINADGGYKVTADAVKAIKDTSITVSATVTEKTNAKISTKVTANLHAKPTTVEPVEDTHGQEVKAAKAFINDVRTAYLSVQDDGDLTTGLKASSEKLNVIAPLMEEDAEQVLMNIQYALEAIIEMHNADLGEFDKHEFSVTAEGNIYTATLKTDTDTETESTTVVAKLDKISIVDEESDNGTDKTEMDIDLEIISIDATVKAVKLTATGTAKVDSFVESGSWSQEENENIVSSSLENNDLTVAGIAVTLSDVNMTFSGTDSAAFVGKISLKVNGLVTSEDESSKTESSFINECNDSGESCYLVQSGSKHRYSNESTETFKHVDVEFDGDLDAGGDKLSVYLNIVADNKHGYVHKETWSNIYSWVAGTGSTDSTTETELTETKDKYVEVSVNARVGINVQNSQNNNVAAAVKLDATRSEFNTVDAKVTVTYNNVDTMIESKIGIYDNKVTPDFVVSNTNGAVATISMVKDVVAGEIKINGIKVASIEETEKGAVLVRYNDGTFESIF